MESKYRQGLIYGLAGIGALFGLRKVASGLSFFRYCLKRPIPLQNTYGAGTWAMITGGSRGIGLEFAKQLGTKGFNIIILDKDAREVNKASLQLTKAFGDSIKVTSMIEDIASLKEVAKDLPKYNISILVNNAASTIPGAFADASFDAHSQVIATNCLGTANATHVLLKQMAERNSKSLIVFMSSFLDCVPSPYNTTYCSSKAFIESFACSLGIEVAPKIDIAVARPLYVKTRLASFIPSDNFLLVTPEEFVASYIKDIEKGCFLTYGHWKHKLFGTICDNALFRKQIIKWQVNKNKQAFERVKHYNEMRNRRNK